MSPGDLRTKAFGFGRGIFFSGWYLIQMAQRLYSTDADIFRRLNELKASGMSIDDAVKTIAEKKYGAL